MAGSAPGEGGVNDWQRGYMARVDVLAMRLAYRELPPEHSVWANYCTVDPRGTYHLWPLTPSRVEWFAMTAWQRGTIYSPSDVWVNRACDCMSAVD
jgi:hypothetical protein